jgi:hypothetical protein
MIKMKEMKGMMVMRLTKQQIFPTLLIVLDVCAALAYVPVCDWRKSVYWLAAAVLTYVVTY